MLDQVAGHHRHPQYGHWIAQHQEGIGARTFRPGEPVAQVDQHGRHHRRLYHTQQKTDADQHVHVADHAGQRGQPTPQDQADENELLDAALFGVDSTRYLEEEVAQKEQRTQ